MSLKRLLGTSLETVLPDQVLTARLLAAAERNLAEAQLEILSNESRFDLAYKCIMQLAMIALHANGFRTLQSRPGHHRTAIQTLVDTVDLPPSDLIVLEALRKQRNLSDYSGDMVPKSLVIQCVLSASTLTVRVRSWLAAHRPDLLSKPE